MWRGVLASGYATDLLLSVMIFFFPVTSISTFLQETFPVPTTDRHSGTMTCT